MSYVSSLVTNCKGEFSAKLEPCTLLVGPNASHKSGAIAAIELGLTGRCDLGALPSNLLELAPTSESLHVALGLSDGQAIEFSIAGSTARASKAIWNGAGIGTVLSREVSDILRSDVKHLRADLLRAAVGDLDVGTLAAAYIPAAFQPLWNELAGAIESTDDLADLPKTIKSRIRELTVTEIIESVDPVDLDTLSQLRSELASVELRLRVLRLRAERDRLIGAGIGTGTANRIDSAKLLRLEKLIEAAQTVANWIARANDYGCPACGANTGDPDEAVTMRQHMSDRLDAARRQLISGLGIGAQERLRAVNEQLSALGDIGAAESIAELEGQAIHLASRLAELEQRQQRYVLWSDRQKQSREAQKRADALKAIGKAVDQMIVAVLDSSIGAFIAAASRVLTPDRLALGLFDGGRQVCRLGIEQANGQVRSWRALSGAERARCVSAIASAWAARCEAQVRLVVVDDVWLDERSLASLCEGLARVVGKPGGPTQAIVAAVELKSAPRGWHVVSCENR